jgi:antitoxin (DNA-binding transcriptional repressor) of toxin-antitoxin stability system
MMKLFKVAEARARFGEILDEAESGATVVIERRGVRFELAAAAPARTSSSSKALLFDHVDPDLIDGQWTWKPGSKGLTFAARRRTRR